MSDALTALASENLNPSLRSLLEDVQRGHIRVPRFQRPFTWTDRQRLELLQSIRDNMPIGSLLVWRTAKFKLATFPRVGPQAIPSTSPTPPATGWQYLLDGHQRVSTLLALLPPTVPSDSERDEDTIDWDIQYDLLSQEFVFRDKRDRADGKRAERPLLPLWTLFDSRHVSKHMRDLRKQAKDQGWTDGNLEEWEERADQLSYRFQQCRIPIVVMVSDDLELATRTFQRINSLGTPMSEAHLVAAMTWSQQYDLRDKIDELRLQFPVGWRELDENLFLQVCKGLTDLDMTKAGQFALSEKLRQDHRLLERAGSGLRQAAEWLREHAFVMNPELLPYALQVVLLAVEFDRLPHGQLPSSVLKNWFWGTGWSEGFASATYRQVRSEQVHLRSAIDHGISIPWSRSQPLPERFDFRSARVRLLALRLALRHGLVDPAGNPVSGRDLLGTHGRDALVRLFPVPRRTSAKLKQLLQGAGNRFLLDPSKDSELRDRLLKGPDLSPEVLALHFVDSETQKALRAGDLETFISRRAVAIDLWDQMEFEAECLPADMNRR